MEGAMGGFRACEFAQEERLVRVMSWWDLAIGHLIWVR